MTRSTAVARPAAAGPALPTSLSPLEPEDLAELVESVERELTRQLPETRLTGVGLEAGDLERTLETTVKEAFEVSLIDAVAGGLAKWQELARHAKSGGRTVVPLLTHRIVSRHHPAISLILNGVKARRAVFDLELALRISGLHATLEDGRLTALAAGTVTLSLAVGLEGRRLWARDLPPFELPARVDLGAGVALDTIAAAGA